MFRAIKRALDPERHPEPATYSFPDDVEGQVRKVRRYEVGAVPTVRPEVHAEVRGASQSGCVRDAFHRTCRWSRAAGGPGSRVAARATVAVSCRLCRGTGA